MSTSCSGELINTNNSLLYTWTTHPRKVACINIAEFARHIELQDCSISARWCGGNDIFKMAAKLPTGTNTDESIMDSLVSSESLERDYASKRLRTLIRIASAQLRGESTNEWPTNRVSRSMTGWPKEVPSCSRKKIILLGALDRIQRLVLFCILLQALLVWWHDRASERLRYASEVHTNRTEQNFIRTPVGYKARADIIRACTMAFGQCSTDKYNPYNLYK